MMDLLAHAAFVAVMSTLLSESVLFTKVRDRIDFYLISCPICLAMWFATPFFYFGFFYYFLVVAVSYCFMLVIMKLYNEVERE